MAEERALTPERELLRLIEEPGVKEKIPRAKIRRKIFSLFSPIAFKARLSFLKTKFKGNFDLQRFIHLEIRVINRFLEITIFILIFYLVGNLTIAIINLDKKSGLGLEIKRTLTPSVFQQTSPLKIAAYYLEKARARDIFKMGLSGVADAKQIPKMPVSKIVEVSKNLKLVGISWSQDPDVIIEDTRAGRAYFLKRGQVINDFKVKAIFKDKVILRYQEEEIELR